MWKGELGFLVRGYAGVYLALALVFSVVYGLSAGPVLSTLAHRSSQLLTGEPGYATLGGGFSANILVSLVSMVLAVAGGTALGVGLISSSRLFSVPSAVVMNLFRNSPWLVVIYAMLYFLPFEFEVFGTIFVFSPFLKASVGLALPVSANFAEIFRGGVSSVPSTQWEAAKSLGYRRMEIVSFVILPQAVPIMIPNIVSLYAALFIGTSLIVVTGTSDVLSMARTIIASEGGNIATGIYLMILGLYFSVCFPIAVASRRLERRLGVRS